ncbi:phosphatase PAP2 family protein [Arthrobacter sp. 35W]|uniref:phosphatase PAP2 family protein n=1 Tax=Arthrobacter sp. 35W TaxID=1132441 RepID=UPI00054F3582|nr:phosphatase PAP2 family protein [Arthrobacter sp. 35W]
MSSTTGTASMSARQAAPHAVLFWLGAVASVLGLVACYLFFVGTTTGQFIDESALAEAPRVQAVIGTPVAQFLDALPATSAVIAAVVVLFVTLARRRWKAAGIALAAMAAANVSTQLLKTALPDRPDVGVATLMLNSLPSGHSTLAASAAAAVFLVVSPRWRPAAAFLGGSYAIACGVSTLVNQWHRPSDVVAAFLVVALWTLPAALVIMRTGSQWNVWAGYGEHWAASRWWPVLGLLLGAGAAGVGCLVLAPVLPGTAAASSVVNYFWAGVALIMACGYLLTMAGTLLLGGQARRRQLPTR